MSRSSFPPSLRRRLASLGAPLELVAPGGEVLRCGPGARGGPRVRFLSSDAFRSLVRLDHLGLAEAYLEGRIEIDGALGDVFAAASLLDLEATWPQRLRQVLALWLRDRRRRERESVAFHYDRPVDFFLPWLDRWRSYSHGFYATPDDDLEQAQERKLRYALEALAVKPGMRVLDMGAGWGCFVEYAGLQGIEVEAITISERQYAFVSDLIERRRLPCRIELVNLRDYRPSQPLDGAVFMGTLEHVPDYPMVGRFLAEHLKPGGRVYADFTAQKTSFELGGFMRKHLWPGPTRYVDPGRLVSSWLAAGFNVHELADDTLSYAYTVRDWADALEREAEGLARAWGEPAVRAFLLFLRGSEWYLSNNRTQAYHLVASLAPAPLRPPER